MKGYLSDKDYNFIYSNSPRICVDLVIRKGRKTFLTKRNIQPYKGTWHLPGGRVRFREKIESAIQRIAKTEIGCFVKVKKPLGYMEFLRERQNGNKRHSISIAFLCEPLCKVKFEKIEDSKIHPIHKKFIQS